MSQTALANTLLRGSLLLSVFVAMKYRGTVLSSLADLKNTPDLVVAKFIIDSFRSCLFIGYTWAHALEIEELIRENFLIPNSLVWVCRMRAGKSRTLVMNSVDVLQGKFLLVWLIEETSMGCFCCQVFSNCSKFVWLIWFVHRHLSTLVELLAGSNLDCSW